MEGTKDADKLSNLKNELHSICEQLSFLGEESMFLSVNLQDATPFFSGSRLGKAFLFEKSEVIGMFYEYCKLSYSSHEPKSLKKSLYKSKYENFKGGLLTDNISNRNEADELIDNRFDSKIRKTAAKIDKKDRFMKYQKRKRKTKSKRKEDKDESVLRKYDKSNSLDKHDKRTSSKVESSGFLSSFQDYLSHKDLDIYNQTTSEESDMSDSDVEGRSENRGHKHKSSVCINNSVSGQNTRRPVKSESDIVTQLNEPISNVATQCASNKVTQSVSKVVTQSVCHKSTRSDGSMSNLMARSIKAVKSDVICISDPEDAVEQEEEVLITQVDVSPYLHSYICRANPNTENSCRLNPGSLCPPPANTNTVCLPRPKNMAQSNIISSCQPRTEHIHQPNTRNLSEPNKAYMHHSSANSVHQPAAATGSVCQSGNTNICPSNTIRHPGTTTMSHGNMQTQSQNNYRAILPKYNQNDSDLQRKMETTPNTSKHEGQRFKITVDFEHEEMQRQPVEGCEKQGGPLLRQMKNCSVVLSKSNSMSTLGTDSPNKCVLCDKTFGNLNTLKKHEQDCSASSGKEIKYKCEYCGMDAYNSESLRIHLKIHTNDEYTI